MTMCSTYIGDLDDPSFSWDGGNWDGNIPKAISRALPPTNRHYNNAFHSWVATSGVRCQQTDFDGWVAVVTKRQIQDFIAFCYDADPTYTDPTQMLWWEGKAYLVEQLKEVRKVVETLSDEKEYALVAECL